MTSAESDRLIIKTMRLAVKGIVFVGAMFVIYIVALFMTMTHDNRRLDVLEQRLDKLEGKLEQLGHRAEAPP